MDPVQISLLFGGITILVNILVLSIGGTWKIGELKASLVKAISDSKDEVEMRQDTHARDVGESLAAIREKIREVELFNRDTFLRRDEFYKTISQNTEALKSLGDKIEARLERMEAKIDGKH